MLLRFFMFICLYLLGSVEKLMYWDISVINFMIIKFLNEKFHHFKNCIRALNTFSLFFLII